MDLSTTIASTAIVLAVVLAAGYAFGEAANEPTEQQRIEAREAQRNTALEEQEPHRIAYERDCETPKKADEEHLACRDTYRRLEAGL